MRGEEFDDKAQVGRSVRNWVRERPASFYDEGIKQLPIW